ncbi:MAG TPA: PadR family transcriptional regulator [Acidimicrobiales bacterium]|nr:PadR family transcriptional regulator [Acidimicrobiales bacterium]
MSLRHGILGLLAGRPMSGYDLTREFDLTLAHVWSARHSQIYPELARLAADGLIEQVGSGKRGRKVYASTGAGRAEVVRWLREDEPGRELRVEAWLQGFFYWMVSPDEAIALIERERAVHEATLERYEAVASLAVDWTAHPENHSQRIMLEAGIRYERGLVDWADWAAAEIRRGELARAAAPAMTP